MMKTAGGGLISCYDCSGFSIQALIKSLPLSVPDLLRLTSSAKG